ncbi:MULTISPECIES: shikimate dehydrogenase [unclassified Modicisalibacter]|uniref:shikimate dehydrogenase n=1 Tax=unclassified Modicisalibacter TaxID=2679913 RepID=UPI001CCCED1C|nr:MULTISPECIES: shikimate dehydrogenase [unclassified Modicisalibacter]MBZ9558013.1 shikimate dehydrogenase [Modicisalibacter sp. R2A 31.J]MBZ9573319.1 shikimate dehydrogenase [Modicisalibacter sp. MOD 31.J]
MSAVNDHSVLVGLIGAGIQRSKTPDLHMEEGRRQGLAYVYKLIDLDSLGLDAEALPELLRAVRLGAFDGLNVTFPCKQAILPCLDDLSDEARAIGAINTVVLRDGKLIGHNTDCTGFGEAFRRNLGQAPRRRVVQMGAGGAGAAVANALLEQGVETLVIFDTDAGKVRELIASLEGRFGTGRARVGTDLTAEMAAADGLVNATPVGMDKLPGMPVPEPLLRADLWVADIIYFPMETELLRKARALGCTTMDGTNMAVFQAVKAFELISGRPADADRMMSHFQRLAAAAPDPAA